MGLMRLSHLPHARSPLQPELEPIHLLLHDEHEEPKESTDDPSEFPTESVVVLEGAGGGGEDVVGEFREGESVDDVFCTTELKEEGEDGGVDLHRVGTGNNVRILWKGMG